MIGVLRSFFAGQKEPETSTNIESAHARLARSFVERDRCRAALDEAQQHLARVHQLLNSAAGADAELETAEAQAAAASQAWAASGAVGAPEAEAFGAASQARSRAYALRLQAAGAKAALPEVEHSVSAARTALEAAKGAIHTAAIDVLVMEAQKHFSVLEELMPKINAAVISLRGLRVLTAGWGKSSLFRGFDRSSSSLTIAERLLQLGFPEPANLVRSLATGIPALRDRDAIIEAESVWLDMAKQLVSDPNAE